MKFKKAHNTLYSAIRELVTSDKYYLDGDLGVKPDGDLIDGTHDGDFVYFCQTFADVLNIHNVNCSNEIDPIQHYSGSGTCPTTGEEDNLAKPETIFRTQDEIDFFVKIKMFYRKLGQKLCLTKILYFIKQIQTIFLAAIHL